MADLPERDAALILDMLIAARNAQNFVHEIDQTVFAISQLHQAAAIRALEVIGEAARRVSANTQADLAQIPWREIIGMRHRLIRGYNDVQLDLVWTTIQTRIPELIAALEAFVPRDQKNG